ncbi:MAG: hypothetical protein FK733_03835 [Asgard group archaeon]|nr:hypothetical protein [Asgard group archaeon]
MSKKSDKIEETGEPRRNKTLLYLAFALSIIGAGMLLIPTILIFMPWIELTWQNLFKYPHTYIALGGLVLLTAGLILQRKITPPMERKETEKLRSRLE